MTPAVFLDRDGVLNQSTTRNGRPYAPTSLKDFIILPGVPEALQQLRQAGFRLVVVTNQPDLSTGKITPALLDEMHVILRRDLHVDDIKVCPHVDADQCHCRKPKPGMLLDAARDFPIDLPRSWMIGDRWRDVSAGKAAGCRTIFIDYGYEEPQEHPPDFVAKDLPESSRIILNELARATTSSERNLKP